MYSQVTIIDCLDSFTHNLVQSFLKLGAPVVVLRVTGLSNSTLDENLGKYLVFSPGPGKPQDYPNLPNILSLYLGKLPILGVCLGFQAINEYFGGATIQSQEIIHGKSVKINHDGTGIFRGIPSPTQVARYHSLMIESISPNFSIQSRYKDVPMAFSYSDKKIAGIQFHPESFMTEYGLAMLQNFLGGAI